MFQLTFLFHGYHTGNRIIVNIYIKNYFKAGLPKFRAIEYILTTIGTCEELQKFGEHEKASTRVTRAIRAKAKFFASTFFLNGTIRYS